MPWFILTIITVMLVGDLVWALVADRWLRPVKHAWLWRAGHGVFMLAQMATLLWVILGRIVGADTFGDTPTLLLTFTYLWHLLLLPPILVLLLLGAGGFGLRRGATWLGGEVDRRLGSGPRTLDAGGAVDGAGTETGTGTTHLDGAASALSRRQLLAASFASAPTLLLGVGVGASVMQAGQFRVRRIDVDLPGLPPPLDGLRLAHVSDLHVGRFTEGTTLRRIVEATNRLRPDLVMLPGDLINNTLSDLPEALAAVRAMESRFGAFLCLGNHDLIDNGMEFVARTRSELPLLVDESAMIAVRGEPVQVLGLSWHRGEAATGDAVRGLARQIQPGAFPILLAHHPHAFDAAADAGIPLTLAGHTHGGQLMLPGGIGFGPLMYRYWSGLYRKPKAGGAAIVVSNGAGNWLPIRTNAPAEIVEVVLHRADRA